MIRKNGDIGVQYERRVPRGPGLVVVDGKLKQVRKVNRGSNRPSR